MSNPYLITFTPIESFFFGGSVSFDDDYYVQSAKFPSQSTIMGALRTSLLIANGFLLQHRHARFVPKKYADEAAKLVGETSLNTFDEPDPNFGVIDKLSPCFLIQTNKDHSIANAYFPIPNDVIHYQKKFQQIEYDFINGKAYNCGKDQEKVPLRQFKTSNASIKHKFIATGDYFGGKAFWHAYLADHTPEAYSDIIDVSEQCYINQSQVGIGTDRGQTKEGQFYVKNDYYLKENFAFAVICHLKEFKPFTNTIVMGGEQSVFQITLSDLTHHPLSDHPIINHFITPTPLLPAKNQIALSPLIADNHIFLDNAICHTLSTRMESVRMLYSVSKKNGSKRSDKQDLKTDAYRMIPAGTVFYLSDNESYALPLVKGIPDIIGYNQLING